VAAFISHPAPGRNLEHSALCDYDSVSPQIFLQEDQKLRRSRGAAPERRSRRPLRIRAVRRNRRQSEAPPAGLSFWSSDLPV